MKKNLMFFLLGVSTTLLMGAALSYWNQINQANKYGVWMNDRSGMLSVPNGNLYGVWMNDRSGMLSVPNGNLYGVWVNDGNGMLNVPNGNQYALVCGGEIGDDAKNAMVVGFIHGMAVGRKKAKEKDQEKSSTFNDAWEDL